MCIICRNRLHPELVSLEQEVLFINGCDEINEISNLNNISKLVIRKCPNLERISDILIHGDINYVEICHCDKLEEISNISGVNSLTIINCINLIKIENFNDISNITISGCTKLKNINSIKGYSNGEYYIKDCSSLENILNISNFMLLNIEKCINLEVLSNTNSINIIHIDNCNNIKKIKHLECLRQIYIMGLLDKLEEICDLSNSKLFIDNYYNLDNITKITSVNEVGIFITDDNMKDSINCYNQLFNLSQLQLDKINRFRILDDYYYDDDESDNEDYHHNGRLIIDNYKLTPDGELLKRTMV
jgi:hypothetical protein